MFIHAKTVVTRWGQALAFLDLDENENECLAIQLRVPLAEGGELARVRMARVRMNVAIPPKTDEAADLLFDAWAQSVRDMTGERVERTVEMASKEFAQMLDEAFARHPEALTGGRT